MDGDSRGQRGPVAQVLRELRADLDELLHHLDAAAELGPLRGGSVGAINRVMTAGNQGVARIPGKHGARLLATARSRC